MPPHSVDYIVLQILISGWRSVNIVWIPQRKSESNGTASRSSADTF